MNTAEELREHYKGVFERMNGAVRARTCDPIITEEEKPQIQIDEAAIEASNAILQAKGGVTGKVLTRMVADVFGISAGNILSRSRAKTEVQARAVLCWLLRSELSYSTVKIGQMLDRDHTSIIHLQRKMDFALPANRDTLINGTLQEKVEFLAKIAVEKNIGAPSTGPWDRRG